MTPLFRIAAFGLCLGLSTAGVTAGGDDAAPQLLVRPGEDGAYHVVARFHVAAPATIVRAVLTDYEAIPRFVPGVMTSRIVERAPGRVRVAQEAVSKYMMFSKRISLVLDITEDGGLIHFIDRIGKSFSRYSGAWTIIEDAAGTTIGYQLEATPAFAVPTFVLRKLLGRDARAMIDGLQTEIAARAP